MMSAKANCGLIFPTLTHVGYRDNSPQISDQDHSKRQYATYARNDTHDFTLNAASGLQTVLTRLEYLNTHLRIVTWAPTPLSV